MNNKNSILEGNDKDKEPKIIYTTTQSLNSLDSTVDGIDRTMHETGVKTRFYVNKDADVCVKVILKGSYEKEKIFSVTAETLMYWYPFYFYYDWGFKKHTNDMVLKVLPTAPKDAKKYLYEDLNITDCVDTVGGKEVHETKLFKDNLALMVGLKEFSQGVFTTLLDEEVTPDDIDMNYTFISEMMTNIKENCKERFNAWYAKEILTGHKVKKLPIMDSARDRVLYSFATPEESRILIKLGAGTRVSFILSKLIGSI